MTDETAIEADLGAARRDFNQRLPGLIDNALGRYLAFIHKDPTNNAKAFGAYSTACRSGLGHLEQLFKLARLTSPDAPGTPPPGDDIETLIANAEAALEKAADDS